MSAHEQLLEMDDSRFLHAWDAMEIEERNALPSEVRVPCIERKRRLSPYIEASVERARRTLRVVKEEPDVLFDRREPGLPEANGSGRTDRGAEPIPGFPVSAIWEGFTPAPYLVKRILAPDELTVLFGQSGHFKSVLAIDLALSVASGTEFHGLRTRQAGVLYVAGEGHGGIRKRLRAWLLARSFDAASEQPALYLTSSGANLMADPAQLRATVDEAAAVLGRSIGLVILDTLAANFGPGDENHASDMALAIHGARTAAPGAAVLLVHHVGHGQSERERGSYALVAAADCRLQATYDEISKSIELRWHKLKDDERPEPAVFGWRSVPLGWTDADGEELSSVVLEGLEGEARAAAMSGPRTAGMGKNQETALKTLKRLYAAQRLNVQEQGRDATEARVFITGWKSATRFDDNRFHEARDGLEKRRLIRLEPPFVYLVEAAQ